MSLLPIPWLFTLQSNFFLFRRESEWILLWKLYSRLFPLFVMLCIAKFFFFHLHLAPLWLSLSSFHPLLFEGWTIYFFLSRKRKKKRRKSHKKVSLSFFVSFWNEENLLHKPWMRNSSIYPSKLNFFLYSLSPWMTFIKRHIKFIIFVVCELLFAPSSLSLSLPSSYNASDKFLNREK